MTSEEAKSAAVELRAFVKRLDTMMNLLDTRSNPCECCGTVKWNNWGQKALWEKLEGLAERAEGAATILAKGASNPEFLGEGEPI